MRPISNLNSVSVKNYVPGSDTLAVIRELKKLGIIKSVAKAKGKSKNKMIEDIKQPSDMVGYTKTLGGGGPLTPNQFGFRQIESGMTQRQIEDIQRSNNAAIAALRAEVEQHRSETQRLSSGVSTLTDLATERFRGAQQPGAGQRIEPFVQSTTIEEIPDTNEERFNETINEGAPELTPEPQQTLYSGGELPEGVAFAQIGDIIPEPRIQPDRKIGGKIFILSKQDVSDELGLGKVPTMRNSFGAVEDYYIALTDLGIGERDTSLNSKSKILAEINNLLEERGKL